MGATCVEMQLATKRNFPAERKTKDHSDKDWDSARLKYVTTKISFAALSKLFGIPEGSLMKHASREEWKKERADYAANLSKVVKEETTSDKVKVLKEWNEDTIVEAKRLREAARRQFMRKLANGEWRFNKNISSSAITAAATANVSADKLVRLALGVATDNTNPNAKSELPASVDDFV